MGSYHNHCSIDGSTGFIVKLFGIQVQLVTV